MKDFTLVPLSSYKTKIGGLVLALAALVLNIILNINGDINILGEFDSARLSDISSLLILIGLFMVAFSKEKIDDERIKELRARAFRFAFMMMNSVIISYSLVTSLKTNSLKGTLDITYFAWLGLLCYLGFFYLTKYFDPMGIYNDEAALTNIRRHKKFFLIWAGVLVLLLIISWIV